VYPAAFQSGRPAAATWTWPMSDRPEKDKEWATHLRRKEMNILTLSVAIDPICTNTCIGRLGRTR